MMPMLRMSESGVVRAITFYVTVLELSGSIANRRIAVERQVHGLRAQSFLRVRSGARFSRCQADGAGRIAAVIGGVRKLPLSRAQGYTSRPFRGTASEAPQ